MSVLIGLFSELSYNLVESLIVLWKTKNFTKSTNYFVMSYKSIDTLSFEELEETDFCHKRSLNSLDTQSEIICAFPVQNIKVGSTFRVVGTLMRSCERLSINLLASSSGKNNDIALHFNPRPLQNYIVRNCKISGCWGQEENYSQYSSNYDLFRGSSFEAELLITEHEYLISVNGKIFCSFKHRMPFKKINSIEVKGDVRDVSVEQYFRENFPSTDEIGNIATANSAALSHIPSLLNIPEGFSKHKVLNIEGIVKMLPNTLTINIQNSSKIWPRPIIGLHINPRFSHQGGKHIMCLNSWLNDKWCKEQRTDLVTKDLSPGRKFKISIETTTVGYSIYINDVFYTEFLFRCDPSTMNVLHIFGDMKLLGVWISKKTSNSNEC